jgi:hypothetical protein
MNTDLIAWVSRGELMFIDPVRGDYSAVSRAAG